MNPVKITGDSPLNLLEKLNDTQLDTLIEQLFKTAEKTNTRAQFFSEAELNCIVDFMLDHKRFARNQDIGPRSAALSGRLWLQLTKDVSDRGVQRTVTQVINAWCKLKKKCRDEHCAIAAAHRTTGNSKKADEMSTISKKVLSVIGEQGGQPLPRGRAGTSILKRKMDALSNSSTKENESQESPTSAKPAKQRRFNKSLDQKAAARDEYRAQIHIDTAKTNRELEVSNIWRHQMVLQLTGIRQALEVGNELRKQEIEYIRGAGGEGAFATEMDMDEGSCDREGDKQCEGGEGNLNDFQASVSAHEPINQPEEPLDNEDYEEYIYLSYDDGQDGQN